MPIKCGNPLMVEIVSGAYAPDDNDLLQTIWDGVPPLLGTGVALELRVLVENSAKVINVSSLGLITFDKPHGLTAGDDVFVWDMGGLYEAHGDREVATVPDAKTLTLTLSTTYSQWTGGGLIRKTIYGPEEVYRQAYDPYRVYHIVPHTVEFAPDQLYAISFWQKINSSGLYWYNEVPERAVQARVRS